MFPRPRDLGAGWSYRVDMGDAEAGYEGSGTPRLARDPVEVATLAVPLGCPRPEELPLARKATEVDYAYRERPVVAVRLVFADGRTAQTFVDARHAAVAGCVGLSGGPAVGPYVSRVEGAMNDRTPESEPWTEIVVRRGAAVLLVAASGPIEHTPLDPATWRRLVGAA
ncbi:MAG TPA: hypothetical protein VFK41_10170 [Nocardioidaceae bacterium]|nr:hypothetical protein [Nocardioidaceae bacterium]